MCRERGSNRAAKLVRREGEGRLQGRGRAAHTARFQPVVAILHPRTEPCLSSPLAGGDSTSYVQGRARFKRTSLASPLRSVTSERFEADFDCFGKFPTQLRETVLVACLPQLWGRLFWPSRTKSEGQLEAIRRANSKQSEGQLEAIRLLRVWSNSKQ